MPPSPDVYADTAPAAAVAPATPPVIKNLQILRFIAAALVLFEHAQYEATTKTYLDAAHYRVLDFFFWPGGVDIFFIISGFIMYTIGRSQFGRPGAAQSFMLRRIIRIVPSYWLFSGLMVVAALALKDSVNHNAMHWDEVVKSLLFIPYINSYGTYYPVLSLGWTLNYEIFFYVLFAAALTFRPRQGLWLLTLALSLLGCLGMTGWVKVPVIEYWFNSIVLEFVFGMALGWLYQNGTRLAPAAGLCLAVTGICLIMGAKHLGLDMTALSWRAIWLGLPALMIATGLVLIEKPGQEGPLVRTLVFGGNLSFALYLSHPFSINIMGLLFARTGITSIPFFIVAAMIASVIGAGLFYLFIEKPLTGWLNKSLRSYKKIKISQK